MVGDRPRQLAAYEIFSTKRNFSSPSPDPLGLRRPVYAGVKNMLLIITSNSDKLFISVNIDDLE